MYYSFDYQISLVGRILLRHAVVYAIMRTIHLCTPVVPKETAAAAASILSDCLCDRVLYRVMLFRWQKR
jgi:hypothetical protein